MYDTDVLIVGAGPTGMTMALELSVQGTPFRIIDKTPERSDKSRALAVQPRTLELLNRHGGAVRDLLSRSNTISGSTVFIGGRHVADINLDNVGVKDTQFLTPVFVSQRDTEDFLEERLRDLYGVEVERPVDAARIQQDGDGVIVTLTKGGGGGAAAATSKEEEETICARYVVGADGADSAVRHAAKLRFDGAPYLQEFILADTHIEWEQMAGLRNRLLVCMNRGIMLIFPLKGDLVRVVLSRPHHDTKTDEDPTLDTFQDSFNHFAPGKVRLHDPTWLARFHLHHRGVDAYRKGRLFVAGDAAHIHSPVGGQGMNTGIQDAVNLAWKLAKVIRAERSGTTAAAAAEAAEALLDSYNLERHPVGQTLLHGTDRVFSWITWTNPVFTAVRNLVGPLVVPWYVADEGRRAGLFRFISEFGINYRDGPLAGTSPGFHGPVHGGDRPPDGPVRHADGSDGYLMDLCRGPSHHLFLFSGTGAGCSSAAAAAARLGQERDRFLQAGNPDNAPAHVVFNGKEGELLPAPDSAPGGDFVVDVGGRLHRQYGFGTGPGYVYVRPDAYVAHIGHLNALEDLVAGNVKAGGSGDGPSSSSREQFLLDRSFYLMAP